MKKTALWPRLPILITVFFLSFFLRYHYAQKTPLPKLRADAYNYVVIAHNLANYGLFTSENPPVKSTPEARPAGYCFFLAGMVKLTGNFQSFYWKTIGVQGLMGALTVIMAFFIARAIVPETWAYAAALLTMLSPHMITMSSYFLTESLFTFLQTGALLAVVLAWQRKSRLFLLSAGVILGLGIWVRPTSAVFPLICAFVLAVFLFRGRPEAVAGEKRKWLAAMALFLLVSFLPAMAWNQWKRSSFTEDTKASDQLKVALLTGTYPGLTYRNPALRGMPYREDPDFYSVIERGYSGIAGYALGRLKESPMTYSAWWLFGKPATFWSWKVLFSDGINFYPIPYSWYDRNVLIGAVRTTMVKLQPVFALTALMSPVFLLRRFGAARSSLSLPLALVYLLIAHYTLMFMVLAPFPRYALPLGPPQFVLSAFFLWSLTAWIGVALAGASGTGTETE